MSSHPSPYAVLLNPNARRVSLGIRDSIGEFVDPEHIYVTPDKAAAEEAIERIIELGYGTVFTGGGDGTVHQFINSVNRERHLPRLGVLPLGTGNALAEIVSSGDPLNDLRGFVDNPSEDLHSLQLCEAEGVRFAFGGVGIDAAILNDYHRLRSTLHGGRLSRTIQSVGGYFAAAFGMTIPRYMRRRMLGRTLKVRVTNLGATAYAIAAEDTHVGRVDRVFAPGEVLYEGPINTAAFGTCPYYGYGMKVLPYAGFERDRFHLRLSNVPLGRLVRSLGKVWKGDLKHPRLHDFQVERVRLEFSAPVPFQIAGEASGERTDLTIGMGQERVDLVRFI